MLRYAIGISRRMIIDALSPGILIIAIYGYKARRTSVWQEHRISKVSQLQYCVGRISSPDSYQPLSFRAIIHHHGQNDGFTEKCFQYSLRHLSKLR